MGDRKTPSKNKPTTKPHTFDESDLIVEGKTVKARDGFSERDEAPNCLLQVGQLSGQILLPAVHVQACVEALK